MKQLDDEIPLASTFFFVVSSENLHRGRAECQTHAASTESCTAASETGGAQTASQSPGKETDGNRFYDLI